VLIATLSILVPVGLAIEPLVPNAGAASAPKLQNASSSLRLLGTVSIGRYGAYQLTVDPNTDRVYAANGFTTDPSDSGLEVIDASHPDKPRLLATINGVAGVVVDSKTGDFFSADGYDDRIVTFDGATNQPIHYTSVNGCDGAFDVDPRHDLVYETTQCDDSLNVVGTLTFGLVHSGPLGCVGGSVGLNTATGDVYAECSGNSAVYGPPPAYRYVTTIVGEVNAIDPTTNRVYVQSSSGLEVYDGRTNSPVGSVRGFNGAENSMGVGADVVDTELNRMYFLAGNGSVAIVDGLSNSSIGTLNLPDGLPAAAIAIDSRHHLVYVVGGAGCTATCGRHRLFVYSETIEMRGYRGW
jgi:hypothetical protein